MCTGNRTLYTQRNGAAEVEKPHLAKMPSLEAPRQAPGVCESVEEAGTAHERFLHSTLPAFCPTSKQAQNRLPLQAHGNMQQQQQKTLGQSCSLALVLRYPPYKPPDIFLLDACQSMVIMNQQDL
jgi:hypothetical protein